MKQGRADRLWQRSVVGVPYLWLLIFFLAPFAIILKISFADPLIALPPFTPFFDADYGILATLDNYRFLTEDNLYWISYLKSIKIALVSTLLCLLLFNELTVQRIRQQWRQLQTLNMQK